MEQRITAALPGVEITASYDGGDRSSVVALLSAAGVPGPAVAAESTSSSAVAAHIAANLRPLQNPVTPTVVANMTWSFTGLGFDACTAPSAAQMTAWGAASQFSGVGVYIGGAGRACTQPNLTSSWVSTEAAAGWHLLPLYVGPQTEYKTITDAAAQGTASADDAATQASALGIGTGAVLYYDMEGGDYTAAQTATVETFLNAWSTELHALHYRAAVYGSETGAISTLISGWGTMTEPEVIDVANWNSQADDDPGSDIANHWAGHRVHQFLGDANATYGGVTINIDQDYFGLDGQCGPNVTATATATPNPIAQPQYRVNCGAFPIPGASATTPSP
jgi:hypothetical protein